MFPTRLGLVLILGRFIKRHIDDYSHTASAQHAFTNLVHPPVPETARSLKMPPYGSMSRKLLSRTATLLEATRLDGYLRSSNCGIVQPHSERQVSTSHRMAQVVDCQVSSTVVGERNSPAKLDYHLSHHYKIKLRLAHAPYNLKYKAIGDSTWTSAILMKEYGPVIESRQWSLTQLRVLRGHPIRVLSKALETGIGEGKNRKHAHVQVTRVGSHAWWVAVAFSGEEALAGAGPSPHDAILASLHHMTIRLLCHRPQAQTEASAGSQSSTSAAPEAIVSDTVAVSRGQRPHASQQLSAGDSAIASIIRKAAGPPPKNDPANGQTVALSVQATLHSTILKRKAQDNDKRAIAIQSASGKKARYRGPKAAQ